MTLTLREGVKFADGTPLTAQDVKWSLDRARDPNNGIWNFLVGSIDSIDASGTTVVLNLKHPDPSIVPALATFNTAILPRYQAQRRARIEAREVGTGALAGNEIYRAHRGARQQPDDIGADMGEGEDQLGRARAPPHRLARPQLVEGHGLDRLIRPSPRLDARQSSWPCRRGCPWLRRRTAFAAPSRYGSGLPSSPLAQVVQGILHKLHRAAALPALEHSPLIQTWIGTE